jgi:hypothetical protein
MKTLLLLALATTMSGCLVAIHNQPECYWKPITHDTSEWTCPHSFNARRIPYDRRALNEAGFYSTTPPQH